MRCGVVRYWEWRVEGVICAHGTGTNFVFLSIVNSEQFSHPRLLIIK